MAKKKRQVKIVWETVYGGLYESTVDEDKAQAYMDRLRSLPDVKTHTVRMVF